MEKRLLLKRTFLAMCLMAVCWIPTRAEGLPGDVNGNGKTDIGDVTALIDYLLGQDTTTIDPAVADVDGDGRVSIADVVGLVDIILEATPTPIDDDPGWVDLGLPSGTIWATRNVGANSPEDYGDYFAWGETEPKSYYDWDTYKWCNGSYYKLTKYCTSGDPAFEGDYGPIDNKTELEPEDDAAYVNLGANWRMPSYDQIVELCYNCTWTWTTHNGVYGQLVTGSNGNTMFLPAAGYRDGGSLYDAGSCGRYWSRTLQSWFPCYAYYIDLDSGKLDNWFFGRGYGFPVRAVRVS